MADPKVKLQFLGDEKDAAAAVTRLEKKVAGLTNRLKQVATQSKRSQKSLNKMTVGTIAGMQAVALVVARLAQGLMRTRAEAERTFLAIDKSVRKLRIQGGLTDLQSKQGQASTSAIAQRTGVSQLAINRITTELISQGFSAPLKTGTTENLISFLQSQGKDVEQADLETLVGGFGKQLTAGKKKLTSQNLLRLGLRVRGLFKSTPLQPEDLPEFARAKSVSTGLVTDENFLSAAAILKGTGNAAEGSVGLRNVILRLGAPERTGVKAFERIGIKKGDVDLVGETLPQALKTLGKAIKALPVKEQLPTLKAIFGQKVAVPAQNLLNAALAGKFEAFAKLQQDKAGFIEGVRQARTGISPGIAKAKSALAEEQRKFVEGGGILDEEKQKQLSIRRLRAISAAPTGFKTITQIGGSIESSLIPLPLVPLSSEDIEEIKGRRKAKLGDLQNQVDLATKAGPDPGLNREQLRVLKSIDKKLDRAPNRNAQGE